MKISRHEQGISSCVRGLGVLIVVVIVVVVVDVVVVKVIFLTGALLVEVVTSAGKTIAGVTTLTAGRIVEVVELIIVQGLSVNVPDGNRESNFLIY